MRLIFIIWIYNGIMELDENIRETEERLMELRVEREKENNDISRIDALIREMEAALAYLNALKDEVGRHGTDFMAQGKDLKGY